MSRPIFWTSSDGKRIINIAAICNAYRQGDGGWAVCTIDCSADGSSIDVKPNDAASFEAALLPYCVGAP